MEIPNIFLVMAGECDSGKCHSCGKDIQWESALGVREELDDTALYQVVYCKKCGIEFLKQISAKVENIKQMLS